MYYIKKILLEQKIFKVAYWTIRLWTMGKKVFIEVEISIDT